MPRYTGPLKFSGSLDGYTVYKRGGKQFIRKKSSLDQQRVSTADEFKASRQAGSFFGLASTWGKVIRRAVAAVNPGITTGSVPARLVSAISAAIPSTLRENPPGVISLSACALALAGWQAHKRVSIGAYFPWILTTKGKRTQPEIHITGVVKNAAPIVKPPKGATHFSVSLLAIPVPDQKHDKKTGKFSPAGKSFPATVWTSGLLPVDEPATIFDDPITLSFTSSMKDPVPRNAIAVIAIIRFYSGPDPIADDLLTGNTFQMIAVL